MLVNQSVTYVGELDQVSAFQALAYILRLTKCALKPERLTLDSPGSSEAEAWD